MQTPEMIMPYGINIFEDQATNTVKYSVDLSFRGEEENERISMFHKQIEDFEKFMIDSAVENTQAWFKKKNSRDVIEAFFSSFLKKSKDKETGEPDGKYPDTIKLKLNTKAGEFECKAFDFDRKAIDEPLDTALVKGTRAVCLIQPAFIWFAGGKFGVTMKVTQMKIKVPSKMSGYAFVDDEEEDADDIEEEEEAPGMVDDDEDDGGEEEAEPEVKKPVRRRRKQ